MSSELESRIKSLEKQIEALDKNITHLMQLKTGPAGSDGRDGKDGRDGVQGERGEKGNQGLPGQTGKPGNIAAAVANAERVLDDKLKSLFDRVDDYAKREGEYRKEGFESFRSELNQHREEVRQSLLHHFSEEATKTRIENLVVRVLHDYGVVSSHDNRVIQAD
jgi:hypothetical protein